MARHYVGAKPIETPGLLASYRIRDFPCAGLRFHPWAITQTQALLLNAYDLLANRRTCKYLPEIYKVDGRLHQYVDFAGPLILDSGAFNFLQHPEITITPEDVLKVGIELQADISVVLDHPFPPNATEAEIHARWDNTRRNTQLMFEALSGLGAEIPDKYQLMPVLHGHDGDTLARVLGDIKAIVGDNPPTMGIGSLAPLAHNGSKRTVIDVLLAARQLLPNSHIHCFSLGSALLMLFAFYCGADTVDSQSWIMSAAFKQVQLPGFHLTRLSKYEAKRNPTKYKVTRREFVFQLMRLVNEEGLRLNDWETGDPWEIASEEDAFAYLNYLEDNPGENRVHRRACHNLYVFNFEAQRARQELEGGTLDSFIQKRMKSTIYKRVFEYAVSQKAKIGV